MNVEINFLEKKKKRKLAPYVFTLLTLILLSFVFGATYFQGNVLNNEKKEYKERLSFLETTISEYQADSTQQRDVIQLQKHIEELTRNALPTVSLYQSILGLLDHDNQLAYYQQTSQHQIKLETRLTDLEKVTKFVSNLLELNFVTDVHLDSVNQVEKGYEANVTVTFDQAAVKKELRVND